MTKSSIILITLGIVLLPIIGLSQSIAAVVADQETRETIPGVFVFLGNSSIGTTTDLDGYFELNAGSAEDLSVIFTHLSYETISFLQPNLPDTIFLTSAETELAEVVVKSKVKKRMKVRRLKRFEAAFLGATRDKKLVKLLNPEVILFDEQKGVLTATADQPLIIENKALGYQITFYLNRFELTTNQDLVYEGDVFFEPLEGTKREQALYKRNRKRTFNSTSRRFFSDLLNNRIHSDNYLIGYSIVNGDGGIEKFNEIAPEKIEILPIDENTFEIPIGQNFTVIHNDFVQREAPNINLTVSLDKLKKNADAIKENKPASFFTSKSQKIILNKYGRIINSREIKEYGQWTEGRINTMLPLDYVL